MENSAWPQILRRLLLLASWVVFPFAVQSQEIRYLPASEAVGYGGSVVARAEDASAVYWNPAALAFLRGSLAFVSVHDAFLTNYLAYAQFFPLYGTVGVGLGRFSPTPQAFDRGTIAVARSLSDDFGLGINLDVNRWAGHTSPTLGLSVLFSPADRLMLKEEGAFLAADRPLRLAFAVQDLPLGRRRLSTKVRAGLEYRPGNGSPWLHTAFHLESGTITHSVGVGLPLGARLSLYGGVESFDPKSVGIGITAQTEFVVAQVVYGRKLNRLLFSLGFRISETPQRLAERHFDTGIQRVREGRLRAGLRSFRRYLEYRPGEPRVLRFVALLEKRFAARKARVDSLLKEGERLEEQGWYVSAALLYRKALEYDPDAKRVRQRYVQIEPQVTQAIDRMLASGTKKLEEGDLLAARTQFERVLMYDANHPLAQRKLEEVKERLRNEADEHYVRGIGYYNQKNLSRARQEFSKAVAIDPDHQEARESLARTERELAELGSKVEQLVEEASQLEEEGKVIEAFRTYREVVKYEPEHELASERLLALHPTIAEIAQRRFDEAQIALERGELPRAFTAASTAVDLNPRWAQARALLQSINKAIRTRTEELLARGEAEMKAERWGEALKAFDSALRLSPRNSRARRLRRQALEKIDLADLQIQGQTAFDQGSYQEALDYFEQILERVPDDETARKYAALSRKRLAEQVDEYFSRGMVFFAAENYQAAIREWDRVLDLDPDHARAIEYRAKAKERLQALKSLP